jgi:hypothetical protein
LEDGRFLTHLYSQAARTKEITETIMDATRKNETLLVI